MLARDLALVAWKERLQTFSNKEIFVGIALLPIIYGVLFPFTFSTLPQQLIPTTLMLVMVFIGVMSAAIQTVYAFAGEREALTLPTLLTTRLSDSALVLGKALYSFIQSLATALLFFVLFALTDYLFILPPGEPFFLAQLDGLTITSIFLIPVLFALFSTAIGMLISIKVKNTKMGAGLATLPELPFIGLAAWFMFANPLNVSYQANVLILCGTLLALSVAVFMLSIGFLVREKMILRQ